jgi:hypothetical protein
MVRKNSAILLCLTVTLIGFCHVRAAQMTQSNPAGKPLSLAIVYHARTYGEGLDKRIRVDNGAMIKKIESSVKNRVSAILVNGVLAYPLIVASLTGYYVALQEKESVELPSLLKTILDEETSHPELAFCERFTTDEYDYLKSFCDSSDSRSFLLDYVPYWVLAPQIKTTGQVHQQTHSDARFMLFLRKDQLPDIEKAFNMYALQKIDITDQNILQEGSALLSELQQEKQNDQVVAQTIANIFNKTQHDYAFNIVISGHGRQSKLTDSSLLAQHQANITELDDKIKEAEKKQEILKGEVKKEAQIQKRDELISQFLSTSALLNRLKESKERAEEVEQRGGIIANLTAQQFGYLLDLLSQFPINIIVVCSCYAGGYNTQLVAQELAQIESIAHRKLLEKKDIDALVEYREQFAQPVSGLSTNETEVGKAILKIIKAQKERTQDKTAWNFIVVTTTAFDILSRGGKVGSWLIQFDTLFSQPVSDDLQEHIRKIVWRDCNQPPSILMPGSTAFMLLSDEDCFWELAKTLLTEKDILANSIELFEQYAKRLLGYQDGTSNEVVDALKLAVTYKTEKQLVGMSLNSVLIELLKVMPRLRIEEDTKSESLTHSQQRGILTLAAYTKNEDLWKNALQKIPRDVINEPYEDGTTFLIYLLQVKAPEQMIDELLNHKDYHAVNVRTNKGTPALNLALKKQYRNAAVTLVLKGADVNAKDADGKTALDIATEKGDNDMVKLMHRYELNNALIDKKYDDVERIIKTYPDLINRLDNSGSNVLNSMLQYWAPADFIEKLISKYQIDVKAHDLTSQQTALRTMIWHHFWSDNYINEGTLELINLLIKHDANINEVVDGESLLSYAKRISNQSPKVIKKLQELGAR